ncbi:MAG: hypothetical protein H6765_05205 [Candidatus Peribacteria bacterium]|nr:MAG: hypothetical protein H6765_05205 [Candidatus Peribacteria bacterium]
MPYPYTQEDAAYWIAHCQKLDGVSAQQYGIYIDGIYAGNCGWEIKEGGRKAQNYRLGYWIGEAYRGQ